MHFSTRSELQDKHAFLSPSNYHWINYTDQKLELRYRSYSAARRGTDLHKLAHEAIRLGVKLSRVNKALATYVNDGILYGMVCEPTLYYSPNCFGAPDTISFRRRKLRIHDLKTGIHQASMMQLKLYAALACLENSVSPFDIEIELRIYQNETIDVCVPDPEEIYELMEKIVYYDQRVEELRLSDRV